MVESFRVKIPRARPRVNVAERYGKAPPLRPFRRRSARCSMLRRGVLDVKGVALVGLYSLGGGSLRKAHHQQAFRSLLPELRLLKTRRIGLGLSP